MQVPPPAGQCLGRERKPLAAAASSFLHFITKSSWAAVASSIGPLSARLQFNIIVEAWDKRSLLQPGLENAIVSGHAVVSRLEALSGCGEAVTLSPAWRGLSRRSHLGHDQPNGASRLGGKHPLSNGGGGLDGELQCESPRPLTARRGVTAARRGAGVLRSVVTRIIRVRLRQNCLIRRDKGSTIREQLPQTGSEAWGRPAAIGA
jgi:hypothetical protein